MITSFVVGAVVASIIWFFVWRNNKNSFATKLEDLDKFVGDLEDTKTVQAIKTKLDDIFNKK